MEKLTLSDFNVSQLDEIESFDINGGTLPWWFPPALAIALVISAVNNWGDIREGLADGFNGTPRH